ncbi:MAG: hypothetical protein R3Y57_01320 [Erysipelotrichaceae bacterium]
MLKALLLSLCILFANNIYYSLQYFNNFDELASQYSIVYQDEISVFDQSQYSYNDLLYELNGATINHISAFMPVISDHISLVNEGGDRKDNLRLSFHDNLEDIDDFVSNNRILVSGRLPINANECIVSLELFEKNDYQLGDTITFLNSLDWNITLDLYIVGVYQDNSLPLDTSFQYTSRRNEIITLYKTIEESSLKDIIQKSPYISHMFLTNSIVSSPHSIEASNFYTYIHKYLTLYFQSSLILIAIFILSFIVVHYFESLLLSYFIKRVKMINHYIKKTFYNTWVYFYLFLCLLIFMIIVANYRFFNKELIYYILNVMNGYTNNSHGFAIPDTLKSFYVQSGETSIFNPLFITIFIAWLTMRYYRLKTCVKKVNPFSLPIEKKADNKIILFSSKSDLSHYLSNCPYCCLSSSFKEHKLILRMLFHINTKTSFEAFLHQQLKIAKKYHQIVVISNDEINYLKYKNVFDQYPLTYHICTTKILPLRNIDVLGYYKQHLIEVVLKTEKS